MKSLQKIIIPMTAMLLIFASIRFRLNPVVGQAEIRYLQLPDNSLPMGIKYNPYNDMVYVALHWTGQLAEINKSTLMYTLYNVGGAWDLAIDGNGDVWISWLPTQVVKFVISDKSVHYIDLPIISRSGEAITFHNGYIWVLNKEFLSKIDYMTNTVLDVFNLPVYPTVDMKGDGNIIWITSIGTNEVLLFDTVSNTVTKRISGFDRPSGIEIDESYIYIAENCRCLDPASERNGTVARINKTSFEITRIETAWVTNEGPYHALKDSYGYIWYTDNSQHIGILGTNKLWTAISPYCYFMTEVPTTSSSEIWFSCIGSAYVGMKETGTLGRTDINKDGIVDIKDIYATVLAYATTPGHPKWNPDADVNQDNFVDMRDIYAVVLNYCKEI